MPLRCHSLAFSDIIVASELREEGNIDSLGMNDVDDDDEAWDELDAAVDIITNRVNTSYHSTNSRHRRGKE